MDQTPRVSVIIPTFNRSNYLHQAIASVLAQSFTNFEILVVDDGSTDDTVEILARFDDPRIKCIHQENLGRSAARNRGLAQACGEYIALLDDDDLFLPDKLSIQVAYLDSHEEVGLVAGGAEIIDEDGCFLSSWEGWKEQPQLSLPACLYACPLVPCKVLFRQQWLDRLDYWFDPDMDRAEDTDLWIRLMVSGCKMAWTQRIVCAYRRHPHNSQQDMERIQRGYLLLLDKLYARPDLPLELTLEEPSIYAHYQILGACHAYAANQIAVGQTRLMRVAEIAPGTMEGDPPAIISSIAGVAQSDRVIADPFKLIDVVFENLPPEMAKLQLYYRYALSALHMQRVFEAHAAHEPLFKNWFMGVYYYPGWLKNRGVWSILIRNLMMHSLPSG